MVNWSVVRDQCQTTEPLPAKRARACSPGWSDLARGTLGIIFISGVGEEAVGSSIGPLSVISVSLPGLLPAKRARAYSLGWSELARGTLED